MKSFRNLALMTLVASSIFTCCQKDENDPATTLGVVIQATGKSFSVLKSTAATPGFVWDTSTMVVSKIEFEVEKYDSSSLDGTTETSVEWHGPKIVDLFSVNTLVGTIDLLPGLYHEISLKVEGYKSDAGNIPVFYLSGNFTNTEGLAIPVSIIVDEDIELRVKQEDVQIDGNSDYTTLVHVELDQLLADVTAADMESATLTSGRVIVSASTNTDIYEKIVASFSTCSESHFSKGRDHEEDDDRGQ